MNEALAIAAAYLIGAIPFGVVVARSKGIDLFKAGSGNIGATNVGRVLGRPYGILVFVLDFFKGALPAGLAAFWRGSTDWIAVAAGLAAVMGHMFPVYLGFRGGKGVATGAGVVCVLLPVAALAAVLAFASTILAGSIMSLASIVAALALPLVQWTLLPDLAHPATVLAILVAVLVVVKHRANIKRLAAGQEPVLQSLVKHRHVAPGMHVLALGLWCGSAAFFNLVAAPLLFRTFDQVAKHPPDWLPLADGGPKDLGSRLAGAAVQPMFPWFFGIVGLCGLVAVGTAVGWWAVSNRRRETLRVQLVLAAFVLTIVSSAAAQRVNALRTARFSDDPAISEPAKAAFGRWHGVSLATSVGALALCVPALALAGYPPRVTPSPTCSG